MNDKGTVNLPILVHDKLYDQLNDKLCVQNLSFETSENNLLFNLSCTKIDKLTTAL